jgi:ABC-type transporter Mla subunit MlaD
VVIAISEAASKTIGLVVTFGGIGLLVNVIIVFIAIQVRGERRQNQEYRERLPDR